MNIRKIFKQETSLVIPKLQLRNAVILGNAEMRKPKYGDGSTVTKLRK